MWPRSFCPSTLSSLHLLRRRHLRPWQRLRCWNRCRQSWARKLLTVKRFRFAKHFAVKEHASGCVDNQAAVLTVTSQWIWKIIRKKKQKNIPSLVDFKQLGDLEGRAQLEAFGMPEKKKKSQLLFSYSHCQKRRKIKWECVWVSWMCLQQIMSSCLWTSTQLFLSKTTRNTQLHTERHWAAEEKISLNFRLT